jgi:hypothetical protein
VVRVPDDMWGSAAFRMLIEDVGTQMALKVLGVPKRTLSQWVRGTRPVPRCAVLALYWSSPLGQSHIDCDHHNEVTTLRALVDALQRENRQLRDRLAQLGSGINYWCANDLFFDIDRLPVRCLFELRSVAPSAWSRRSNTDA